MAVFRKHSEQKRDRSARDRSRHKELVREKVKQGIADIVAEESIIGKSKDKIIKIPIKGIKEYQFIFGNNKGKGVAQGNGDEAIGDVLQKRDGKQEGEGGPGNEAGSDIYETDITLEDAINMMFEDLELPEIDRKKIASIKNESKRKISGYQKKGIRSKLAKRKTVKNKIKRKIVNDKILRNKEGEENQNEGFSFIYDDLVYKRTVIKEEEISNAVVFCVMDTSGSMDQTKKYLARSFYFLLYQFLKSRYRNTEIVFISHHIEAKEVSEDDFFHKAESGGTYISSGYEKVLEIIDKRFNPALWNIYAFHCSDGDNFQEDNDKAVELAKEIAEVSNLFGYAEIKPGSSYDWSSMLERYEQIKARNFVCLKIKEKQDIWPTFKNFLMLDSVNNEQYGMDDKRAEGVE